MIIITFIELINLKPCVRTRLDMVTDFIGTRVESAQSARHVDVSPLDKAG